MGITTIRICLHCKIFQGKYNVIADYLSRNPDSIQTLLVMTRSMSKNQEKESKLQITTEYRRNNKTTANDKEHLALKTINKAFDTLCEPKDYDTLFLNENFKQKQLSDELC